MPNIYRFISKWFLCSLSAILILSACSQSTLLPTSTTAPGQVPEATATTAPSPSSSPTNPAPTSAPTATQAVPTLTPFPTEIPDNQVPPEDTTYLDDRSTPTGLMLSFFNAINRKEYLRAYSYWQNPTSNPQLPTFDKFQQGYADTASVQPTLGTIGGDVGAGQIYYSVPVTINTTMNSGQGQTYVGCYYLHLSRPEIQGVPPFQPLAIESAKVNMAQNGQDVQALLAQVCQQDGRATTPITPSPVTNTTDISTANYLDDRSDPILVLRSLFNAVNRKEYVRAYSYWESPENNPQLPPFDQFEKGYADTQSAQLETGKAEIGAAAGNIYYQAPVIITAQTTSGQQVFTGCYQLHLAQPAVQGVPPFQPLAIQKATVKQVADRAAANGFLDQPCQVDQ